MARPKFNFVVLDPGSGKARPGAWVTVTNANTLSKVLLYHDDDFNYVGNPVQANGLGQVAFRVDPGLYDISMTWDGAQPTVIEDVLAWTPEGAVIQEKGDLIRGNETGAPERLPLSVQQIGQTGPILQSLDGQAKWWHLGPGTGLPDGQGGSLLTYDAAMTNVEVILPGQQDQALAMMGGVPSWVSTLLPPGTTLPISQPGDLVVGQVTTGAVARLARGATDHVLKVAETGGLYWGSTDDIAIGGGNCFLSWESPTTLRLVPYKGNKIWVDGRARTIPAGGITLAPTGLTPWGHYYIYAAWVSNALVLEASTTISESPATGLRHKVGDATRTLVGLACPLPGPVWSVDERSRLVLSYFNQFPNAASGYFTAPRTSAVTSPAGEVHSEIQVYFLSWGYIPSLMSIQGILLIPMGGTEVFTFLVLDSGSGGTTEVGHTTGNSLADNTWTSFSFSRSKVLTEGMHTATLYTSMPTGPAGRSVTYHGSIDGLIATRIQVLTGNAP